MTETAKFIGAKLTTNYNLVDGLVRDNQSNLNEEQLMEIFRELYPTMLYITNATLRQYYETSETLGEIESYFYEIFIDILKKFNPTKDTSSFCMYFKQQFKFKIVEYSKYGIRGSSVLSIRRNKDIDKKNSKHYYQVTFENMDDVSDSDLSEFSNVVCGFDSNNDGTSKFDYIEDNNYDYDNIETIDVIKSNLTEYEWNMVELIYIYGYKYVEAYSKLNDCYDDKNSRKRASYQMECIHNKLFEIQGLKEALIESLKNK
ncbi:MAG: hypothetical protein ACRCX2_14945 [Paraclostridium sp.]